MAAQKVRIAWSIRLLVSKKRTGGCARCGYIEHLKTVDRETLLVSLSDKVHNARSILRDLRKPEIGSAVWSRFGKRPKEDTLWYYRELANAFQGLLPGQLAEELMEIVIVLENE